MRSDLLFQALSTWEKVFVPLEEGWRELEQGAIETLLLHIEKERRTGVLELVGPRHATNIQFQSGFVSSLSDREHHAGGWTPAGLLSTILGWRVGKYRFVEKKEVKVDPGFPLRPGQLLTLGWLLFMERRERFLRKQELFKGFVRLESRLGTDTLLRQILSARLEKKSGELEVASRPAKRRLTFVDGELAGIQTDEPTSILEELCLRFEFVPAGQVKELLAECERSRKRLIPLALERNLLGGVSLELLHAIADWEQIIGCFQWDRLHSFWVEPGGEKPVAGPETPEAQPPSDGPSAPARCSVCGATIPEGMTDCERCGPPLPPPSKPKKKGFRSRLKFRPGDNAVRFLIVAGIAGLTLWWSLSHRRAAETGPGSAQPPAATPGEAAGQNAEVTVSTVGGEVVTLNTNEIKSYKYEAERDMIQLRMADRTVEVPFSEVEKFPANVQRALNLTRQELRK